MARFTIIAVRNPGTASTEFDVEPIEGQIAPGDIIKLKYPGYDPEYLILAVVTWARETKVTLVCLNWTLPQIGLCGITCESRPMKGPEKRKYVKHLHAR